MIKCYSEMLQFPTFEERYRYLRIGGQVGRETFGYDRYLNQLLYRSKEWKSIRDRIIIRDDGQDLGLDGRKIYGRIYIHHINPITKQDVLERSPKLFDPENLICCTYNTHQAIHYGDEDLLIIVPEERTKNDTCPWKK